MAVEQHRANDSSDDPDATRIVLRADPPSGLCRGTRLRDLEIDRVIGEGGFSIVYAAVDLNLRRRVAVKEYMPTALARRGEDRTVHPRTGRDSEVFDLGRRSFLNEARLLAQFDHPALVKVHQFWEENGTAYMVMPLYEGRTLKQWLKERAQPPNEDELGQVVAPILDALEHLHAARVFHRDIAPDNVLLLGDGRPVLLDFGAARKVLADSDKALTAILKPSYAPIEQYADMAQLRQGPWTDVYALCAVLYFAITGAAPPSAVSRSISDKMVPAVKAGAGRYSARFLRAIDAGLGVLPDARPQSIAQLRELLLGGPATIRAPGTVSRSASDAPRTSWWRSHRTLTAVGVGTLLLVAGGAAWIAVDHFGEDPDSRPAAASSDSSDSPRQPAPAAAAPSVPVEAPASNRPQDSPSRPGEAPAAGPVAPVTSAPVRAPASPPTPPSTTEAAGPAQSEAASADRRSVEPSKSRRSSNDAAVRAAPSASSHARCVQILQRMQLGELPSPEEKSFMQKECS